MVMETHLIGRHIVAEKKKAAVQRLIQVKGAANTVIRFLIEFIVGNIPHHRLLYSLMDNSSVLQIKIQATIGFYGITQKIPYLLNTIIFLRDSTKKQLKTFADI